MKLNMNEHYKKEIVLNTGMRQFMDIQNLDRKYVGTNDYMGFCYFWDHEIKHYLRDATAFQRVKVHKLFLQNKIPFDKKEKYFKTNERAMKIVEHVFKVHQ